MDNNVDRDIDRMICELKEEKESKDPVDGEGEQEDGPASWAPPCRTGNCD